MNIQGDVNIVGTITFGGSGTSVTTSNLAVDAPIIFSGTGNTDDLIDLGQVGTYAVAITPVVKTVTNKALTSNVVTLTSSAHGFSVGQVVTVTDVDSTFNGTYSITAVTTDTFSYAKEASNVSSTAVSPTGTATVNKGPRYSGVVRDASDGVVKVFSGLTAKPTTSVNFSDAGIVFAPVQIGSLTVGASKLTVNSTSGATAIAGDLSINTDKFTVNSTTGAVAFPGTLTVNTYKFVVNGSSGAVTLSGDVDGGDKGYTKFHSRVSALGNQSGSISINIGTAPVVTLTPTGTTAVTFTGFPASGYAAYWEVEVVSPGSNAITFANITWNGGAAIAAQTGTKKTVFAFRTRDGGTTIYGATTFGDIA
jgi:hypothetical protein